MNRGGSINPTEIDYKTGQMVYEPTFKIGEGAVSFSVKEAISTHLERKFYDEN